MGFPVSYAGFLPKLLIITAILVVAFKEFFRSMFQLVGLYQETYTGETLWQSATGVSLDVDSRMHPSGISAGAIRASLMPLLFDVLLDQCPDKCDGECAVCLSEFDKGQEVRVMPYCRHVFHKDCIDRWLEQEQKTCPLCRSSLSNEELSHEENPRDQIL